MYKFIGVIPARYQSSRFEGKPLAKICGKPMIYWVYHQVKKVSLLEKVVIATDDRRIYDLCEKEGLEVMMTSSYHATGTDRLGEVATRIDSEYFINIQGDEPLIEPYVIEAVVDACIKFPEFGIINTMSEIRDTEDLMKASVVKVACTNENVGLFLSRAPIPFSKSGKNIKHFRHLGLYGLKKEELMFFVNRERGELELTEDIEMFRFLEAGKRIKFVEVKSNSISVDVPGDIKLVEKAMEEQNGNH